jgi:hypothetical protein
MAIYRPFCAICSPATHALLSQLVKRWDSDMSVNDGGTLCSGGSCVRSLATGAWTTLFRTEAGDVYAAGSNAAGQLGNLTGSVVGVPKAMVDLHSLPTTVGQIAAAGSHTVFLSYECSNTLPPCYGAAQCKRIVSMPSQ